MKLISFKIDIRRSENHALLTAGRFRRPTIFRLDLGKHHYLRGRSVRGNDSKRDLRRRIDSSHVSNTICVGDGCSAAFDALDRVLIKGKLRGNTGGREEK